MQKLQSLFLAIIHQDFNVFLDKNIIKVIYFITFLIIFLENVSLFTAFFPGDSFLIFLGILANRGVINLFLTILVSSFSAGLGSWINFLQAKWLVKRYIVRKYISYISGNYYKNMKKLIKNYGYIYWFLGRFVTLARTLLPTIISLSGIKCDFYFHLLNWTSALTWSSILITLGYFMGNTTIFSYFGKEIIIILISILIFFLLVGILSLTFFVIKIYKKKLR
ncbi:MAG: DedA family protein [Enterobacteriaceae bacterium]